MTPEEMAELAMWPVTARVECPCCGEQHDLLILASELIGCEIDDQGVYHGEDIFRCAVRLGVAGEVVA